LSLGTYVPLYLCYTWSRDSPYVYFSLKVLVLVFDSTISARSRLWLVASELEVHSSKCSMSYRRRLKRDLLGHEGCWG
jgi:hypothetical protein